MTSLSALKGSNRNRPCNLSVTETGTFTHSELVECRDCKNVYTHLMKLMLYVKERKKEKNI